MGLDCYGYDCISRVPRYLRKDNNPPDYDPENGGNSPDDDPPD